MYDIIDIMILLSTAVFCGIGAIVLVCFWNVIEEEANL